VKDNDDTLELDFKLGLWPYLNEQGSSLKMAAEKLQPIIMVSVTNSLSGWSKTKDSGFKLQLLYRNFHAFLYMC